MKNDAISRQEAIEAFKKELTTGEQKGKYVTICSAVSFEGAKQILEALPAVQPEIIRCKDCKHWIDSDGVYRRGVNAESKCPLNTKEVYAGTFYCGDAERRTDER